MATLYQNNPERRLYRITPTYQNKRIFRWLFLRRRIIGEAAMRWGMGDGLVSTKRSHFESYIIRNSDRIVDLTNQE